MPIGYGLSMTKTSTHSAFLLAGVLGWPVHHSLSPALHGHWLARHGIAGAYLPLAAPPERLSVAVAGLGALGFVGANVTVPHKEAVVSACARLTPTAQRLGAVNTLMVQPDGGLVGDNTDLYGFTQHLRQAAPGLDLRGRSVTVLGAGGAARAIIAGLADLGAAEIRVANRTAEKVHRLSADLNLDLLAVDWAERSDALADCVLLVNSTALGMSGQPSLDLSLAALPSGAVVYDIVYAPLETPLLAAARERALLGIDGLGMLLHQARPGFAAWFGVQPQVDEALRTAVLAARATAS